MGAHRSCRPAEQQNAQTAWIWTLLCEEVVAYVHSETRAAETPKQLMTGTAGNLVTDGCSGYNGAVAQGKLPRS